MKLFIALLTFLLPSTVFASSIVAVDEATLVTKADTIAVVSVLSSEAYAGSGGIRTRFYLQVHEGLRNAREGQVIQMDVPGGSMNGMTSVVTGAPRPVAGSVWVVFLESHGSERRPLGLSYGVYPVVSSAEGKWQVGREIAGLSLLGTHGRELDAAAVSAIATRLEPYSTFVTRIRQRIAQGSGVVGVQP